MIQTDERIKRKLFPFPTFLISLLVFALISTVQMKIIGSYIDVESIPRLQRMGVYGFWFFGAASFTLVTNWKIRQNYQRPLEVFSAAARRVAQGDFSVYLRPRHTPDKADHMDVLFEDFNKMVEELGSIETLKTDFFSDVSHEFKSPLAVIASNAELLQADGGLTSRQQEQVENIRDATGSLADLIQNMLKLNKLEKQAIRPMPEAFDLCAQLCECAVQFEDVWEKKDIDFEADLEDTALAYADPGLTGLVWTNLLANAIKFTPEGGHILLTQRTERGRAVVSVQDTGCGMTPEVLQHIFEKFYQGDASHATQGNGLGLALVKRILELSEGTIAVTSEPGKGSVFTVTLPLAPAEQREERPHGT